ncbi:GPW/gp25 family protein [Enterobacteriaceae bacterium LUAb1]
MHNTKLINTLGQCWAFPPQFSAVTGVTMAQGIDAVLQSLHVLFLTETGERIQRESWGGGLNDFIFENVSDELLPKIQNHIEETILRSETRVVLKEVSIQPVANNVSRLRVRITVCLSGSNITETIAGTLNLNEGQPLRLI